MQNNDSMIECYMLNITAFLRIVYTKKAMYMCCNNKFYHLAAI